MCSQKPKSPYARVYVYFGYTISLFIYFYFHRLYKEHKNKEGQNAGVARDFSCSQDLFPMASTETFFSVKNVPSDDVFLNSAVQNTLRNSEKTNKTSTAVTVKAIGISV